MLTHLKMIEIAPNQFAYADPNVPENWIDDPCYRCGAESHPATCEGDYRRHRAGWVHVLDQSGPVAVCHECAKVVEAEWKAWRAARNSDGTLRPVEE